MGYNLWGRKKLDTTEHSTAQDIENGILFV